MRLFFCRMFSLLSRLLMSVSHSDASNKAFGSYAVHIVEKLIIPNCVWQAGRYVIKRDSSRYPSKFQYKIHYLLAYVNTSRSILREIVNCAVVKRSARRLLANNTANKTRQGPRLALFHHRATNSRISPAPVHALGRRETTCNFLPEERKPRYCHVGNPDFPAFLIKSNASNASPPRLHFQ